MAGEQTEGRTEDLGLDGEYLVTDDQAVSLYEHGWALLPGLLGPEVVERIRSRLAEERLRPPDAVAKSYSRAGDVAEVKVSNLSHEAMAWRDPLFNEIATSRRLAGTAVRLMQQPSALFAQDISFIKPGGAGPSPLHQDYSYYPFDRKGEVSLWIALVDMSDDMGPLHYLDASHLEGPLGLDDGVDIRETYPHLRDRSIVGGRPLAAGDAQAHWDLTIHGARPNGTATAREAYVVRYIRADTVYSGVGHPHFDAFDLAPGDRFADSGAFPRVDANGLVKL